jgi:hypothetical protein
MPGLPPRLPAGFDRRTDLLLEFKLDEQGQETVELVGAAERGPVRVPASGSLPERLPKEVADWLVGADDPRRLVVRDWGTGAANEPWEGLDAVGLGKIRLVRVFPDIEPPEPKPPGESLRALIVIAHPVTRRPPLPHGQPCQPLQE